MNMKKFILDFLQRALIASGIGPIVLAIVYLIVQQGDDVHTLSVSEVCIGIVSLTALAFIAGGMNAIYQIERLPLMTASIIHGCVLYVAYLCTYLVNDWLDVGVIPIVIFSAIFVVGYVVIWMIIYSVIKKSTLKINEKLRKNQENVKNQP